MLSTWDSPRTFLRNLLTNFTGKVLPNVRTNGLRRESNRWHRVYMSSDQLAFAFIPGGQEFGRRSGSDKTWMGNARETNPWDVARGGVNAWMQICVECFVVVVLKPSLPLRSQMALAALLLNSRAARTRQFEGMFRH
jgi:hypothetical protein